MHYIICVVNAITLLAFFEQQRYAGKITFTKKKKPGVYDVYVGDKHLIEAVV